MTEDKGAPCLLGNQFSGVKRLIHEVLMETELYSGCGAYIVSYAHTNDPDNKSGLSFGVNQMDMKHRKDARTLFIDILKNAKDNKGCKIISDDKLKVILGKDNCNLVKTHQTPKQVFGENLVLVNAALGSQYGMKKINEVYIQELNNGIQHIEKAISMMKNPAAKAFYSSNLGKVLLFEYHNQFVLELKGSLMIEYIDGEYTNLRREDCKTHEKYKASTTSYGLADHKKFIFGTDQCAKTPGMINERLKKAEATYNKYALLCLFDNDITADAQEQIVAIRTDYEDWLADILNRDTLDKVKSNFSLKEYLSERFLMADELFFDDSKVLEINTNDAKGNNNDSLKKNHYFDFDAQLTVKANYKITDSFMLDASESIDLFTDHHIMANSPIQDSFNLKTHTTMKNNESNKPSFETEDLLREAYEMDEIVSFEVAKEKKADCMLEEGIGMPSIEYLGIRDPLVDLFQDC